MQRYNLFKNQRLSPQHPPRWQCSIVALKALGRIVMPVIPVLLPCPAFPSLYGFLTRPHWCLPSFRRLAVVFGFPRVRFCLRLLYTATTALEKYNVYLRAQLFRIVFRYVLTTPRVYVHGRRRGSRSHMIESHGVGIQTNVQMKIVWNIIFSEDSRLPNTAADIHRGLRHTAALKLNITP